MSDSSSTSPQKKSFAQAGDPMAVKNSDPERFSRDVPATVDGGTTGNESWGPETQAAAH